MGKKITIFILYGEVRIKKSKEITKTEKVNFKWQLQEYPTKKRIKNIRHDFFKSLKLINGPEC